MSATIQFVASVPAGHSLEATAYEDTDGDGSPENIETQAVSDGTNSVTYSTLDGSTGNDIWIQFSGGDTSDPTTQATVSSWEVLTVLTINGPVTTVASSTPSPQVGTFVKGNVELSGSGVQGAKVYVIDDTNGGIEGTDTTDSNGDYQVKVTPGITVHVAVQYDDGGTKYNDESKPFVTT